MQFDKRDISERIETAIVNGDSSVADWATDEDLTEVLIEDAMRLVSSIPDNSLHPTLFKHRSRRAAVAAVGIYAMRHGEEAGIAMIGHTYLTPRQRVDW